MKIKVQKANILVLLTLLCSLLPFSGSTVQTESRLTQPVKTELLITKRAFTGRTIQFQLSLAVAIAISESHNLLWRSLTCTGLSELKHALLSTEYPSYKKSPPRCIKRPEVSEPIFTSRG